jgi:hypothetical protein
LQCELVRPLLHVTFACGFVIIKGLEITVVQASIVQRYADGAVTPAMNAKSHWAPYRKI